MNKSYIIEDYDLETVTNAKHVSEMLALIFYFGILRRLNSCWYFKKT